MKNALKLLAAAGLVAGLGAGGQSGPLYIPGNPSQVQEPPAEQSEDRDEEEEKRENEG